MAELIRQIGHWRLTHAQLWDGGALVDEKFTITHPTRDVEFFNSRAEAEKRFDELVATE